MARYKMRIVVLVTSFISLSAMAAARPNILFFLADDMGYGDAGYLSTGSAHGRLMTPQLDRMVADGGTTLYVYKRSSLFDSVLQRAATPEVSSVLAALAVARIMQVLRQYFAEF